jgi:hypothetical protein
MLKVTYDLMQEYKPLRLADPEKEMTAVCNGTFKGFFSIASDGRLFLTCQTEASENGWKRTDLSKSIIESHPGAKTVTFCAANNRENDTLLIAAVFKSDSEQFLYVSHSSKPDNPAWELVDPQVEVKKYPIRKIVASSNSKDKVIAVFFEKPDGTLERYLMGTSKNYFSK